MGVADIALIDGLVQLSFAVQSRLTDVAAQHDLSLTQVRLLGVLRDRDLGVQQLADLLGLEKSSASGLIDRAEARGLVRKAPSLEDGRAVRVSLSKRGRAMAEQGEREVEAALQAIVAPLTKAQREDLSELVARCMTRS